MNAHRQTFEIARGVWRICEAPSSRWPHLVVEPAAGPLRLRDAHLSFAVSSDEEHVQLHLTQGGRTFDMGARGHNYLLLTLARRRLQDAAQGFPETACGWICLDDVDHDPMMMPPRLNIDVFRIRKHFAAHGVVDAESAVERRPRTRQLRIGTGRLSVVRV
jgi:hypothetical protein